MKLYTHAEVIEDIKETEGAEYNAAKELDHVLFLQLYSFRYTGMKEEKNVTDLRERIKEFYNDQSNLLPVMDILPNGEKLFNFYVTEDPINSWQDNLNVKLTLIASTNDEEEIKASVMAALNSDTYSMIKLVYTDARTAQTFYAPQKTIH